MGLENASAYPQIIFFIVLTSVIITTIGLGKAKNIPPPDYKKGGFVSEPKNKPTEVTSFPSTEESENKPTETSSSVLNTEESEKSPSDFFKI